MNDHGKIIFETFLEVDLRMSQAIMMSYGEIMILAVVMITLLFAAFRKK